MEVKFKVYLEERKVFGQEKVDELGSGEQILGAGEEPRGGR